MKSARKYEKEMNPYQFPAYVSFTDLKVPKNLFIASSRYVDMYLCMKLHERTEYIDSCYYDVLPFKTYKNLDRLSYTFIPLFDFQIILGNTDERLWYIVTLSIILKFALSIHHKNQVNELFDVISYNYNMKKYIK